MILFENVSSEFKQSAIIVGIGILILFTLSIVIGTVLLVFVERKEVLLIYLKLLFLEIGS